MPAGKKEKKWGNLGTKRRAPATAKSLTAVPGTLVTSATFGQPAVAGMLANLWNGSPQ